MRQLIIAVTLFFLSISGFAQSEVEVFIEEGIEHHDKGEFVKAIESYEKALQLDPNSALANYEISLSYFSKGDYENALKYSDIVLKQDGDYVIPAYMTKGSALDMLGRTKESIKFFEKAIKKTKGHYLLYYNLALNHFKLNDLDNAEKSAIKGIENNPNHSSSHLLLGIIHDQQGNSVQTLLAAHYFLLLEPNTKRSVQALEMLQENFGGNVSKDPDKPNTINITISPNDDKQFGAAEMMVAMLEASKTLEKNEGKTEDEMFVENTESFFKVLGELKKDKNKEIWWTFYTPFFYDLAKSDHLEAYCKYITQSDNKNYQEWLGENEAKLNAFAQWLQED